MQSRPKIALVMVSHDRGHLLERAIGSVETLLPELAMFYLVDAGSTDPLTWRIIRETEERLSKTRRFLLLTRGDVGPAVARNAAFSDITRAKVADLVLFLDDDDYIGSLEFVSAMRDAWQTGADILVPREINVVYEDCHHTQELCIPSKLDFIDSWAELMRVGATFGITRTALERVGGFKVDARCDEWVEMYCRMIRLGMQCHYADVAAESSYHYVQHGVQERGHARRVVLRKTAADKAREVLTNLSYPLTVWPAFRESAAFGMLAVAP